MNNLARLRKEKGLSQSQLAQKINVAQNTISQWEREVNAIDSELLRALADYFGVTTDYLLGRTDDPTPPDAKKEAPAGEGDGLTEIKKDVIQDLKQLSDEDIQSLHPVIKSLLKNNDK